MPKILLSFFLVMPLTLLAQRHGFLKYGVGFSYDKGQFFSDDPTARFVSSRHVIAEFLYDQYITKYFSVEGGIRDKFVQARIDFYDTDTTQFRLAGNLVVFPLRVKARFSFLKNFLFTPGVGASILISHTFTGIDDRFSKPYQEFSLPKDFPKNYFTLDLNAGLHFLISQSWKVSIDYTYSIHSKTIAEGSIQNTLRSTSSTISTKGTFHMFTIGIGYRLSNIWIKERKPRGKR